MQKIMSSLYKRSALPFYITLSAHKDRLHYDNLTRSDSIGLLTEHVCDGDIKHNVIQDWRT